MYKPNSENRDRTVRGYRRIFRGRRKFFCNKSTEAITLCGDWILHKLFYNIIQALALDGGQFFSENL